MIAYRGREGMWAWVLNRVTGLGVVLFLYVHVVDTFLIGFGPEVYNEVMGIYRSAFFRVLEVALAGSVMYHGINGIRLILVNFWGHAARIEKQLFYGVIVVTLALFLPTAFIMFRALLTRGG